MVRVKMLQNENSEIFKFLLSEQQFNLFKWRLGQKSPSMSASFLRIICKMSYKLPPPSVSMLLAITMCQGVTHILRLVQGPLHP